MERARFDELDEALAALKRRGEELQGGADARTVDLKLGRRLSPSSRWWRARAGGAAAAARGSRRPG